MSNETEVKPDDVPADATPTAPVGEPTEEQVPFEPIKMVQGEVTIKVGPQGLSVGHPQNLLIALAIIDAGRMWIEMQYTDALRAAQKSQPKIARPGDMPAPSKLESLMRRLQ